MPQEMLENVCSFLGGYSYVASLVPYLRSCVEGANKEEFLLEVYKKQDLAFISKYGLFPTYKVVKRCVSFAVQEENLELVSWLFEQSQGKLLQMIAEQAALHGSFLLFTWAHEKDCSITDEMFYKVIRSGNSKLYKFMRSKAQPPVRMCTYKALRWKRFRMLPTVFEEYEDLNVVCEMTATGNWGLIESFSRFHDVNPCLLFSGACLGMQKDIVLRLKDKYNLTHVPLGDDLPLLRGCYVFLKEDKSEEEKLDFLQFLDQNFTVDYMEATYELSSTDHMSILKWCLSKGSVSTKVFHIACRNTVQDMEYLYNLGYFRNIPSYYNSAVYSGRPENLTWLESKGLTIPKLDRCREKSQVVQGSIIPCLQWLVDRKITILGDVLSEASSVGDLKTFYWLLDNVEISGMMNIYSVAIRREKFNLEVFTALLPYLDKEKTKLEIEKKKQTRSNYLLYEEAERLLAC